MLKVPEPVMVATDGGKGFKKAARAIWPNVNMQRCLVHVARQMMRKTTMNPQLEARKNFLRWQNA